MGVIANTVTGVTGVYRHDGPAAIGGIERPCRKQGA
jgi:hypothetical protein